MRKFLLTILSALMFMPSMAKKADGPVMTVGGYEVSKSEFGFFLKNNYDSESYTKKELKEYAKRYVDFKMKVQAAVDEGLDLQESFIKEMEDYANATSESYLVDMDFLEQKIAEVYEQSKEAVGPDGLCNMGIIAILPKDDSMDAYLDACYLLDSIYGCLERGEDFQELAVKYSDDSSAKNGGITGWMAKGQLPEAMAENLFKLETGTCSQILVLDNVPFVLKCFGRKDYGTFEENYQAIYNHLREETYVYDEAMIRKAEAYSLENGWGVSGDAAVHYMDSLLEVIAPEYTNLVRQYHDGNLMFEITSQMIWDKVANDTEGLSRFFEANRENFWKDGSRFKGTVLFCKDEALFRKVEAALEGVPFEAWSDTIISYNKNNSLLRAMRGSNGNGVFEKGQNAYVDKLVFGEGSFEPMKGFPYTNVVGKLISSPETISDAASLVTDEYQKSLANDWNKQLHKKYKYRIYKKALYSFRP